MDFILDIMPQVLALVQNDTDTWRPLVNSGNFKNYLKRAEQMVCLERCICPNLSVLEAYVSGLFTPHNMAKDQPCPVPPELEHTDPMNHFNEQKMSPNDVLSINTECHWTKGPIRKDLFTLAFDELTEKVGKSVVLFKNMKESLSPSWFTSARALIQDVSDMKILDDEEVLSLIIATWDELFFIYKKENEIIRKKNRKSKKLNASDIKELKRMWLDTDFSECPDALQSIYTRELAEQWWLKIQQVFKGFQIDAKNYHEFYPCDTFNRVTEHCKKMKSEFLDEFDEDELLRKRSKPRLKL